MVKALSTALAVAKDRSHACWYNLTRDIIQGMIMEYAYKLGSWELGESIDQPIINSPSLTLMLVTHNLSAFLKQQPLHILTARWEQHISGQLVSGCHN